MVHGSDGSGTTGIFTAYLSAVSSDWKTKVGSDTSVNWPVGLGGKGNQGVSGQVKQSPGAIGYVELIYALQTQQPYAQLKNAEGQFITPSLDSVSAAMATAKIPADLRFLIVNGPGEKAYPIAGCTYSRLQGPEGSCQRPCQGQKNRGVSEMGRDRWSENGDSAGLCAVAGQPAPARVEADRHN